MEIEQLIARAQDNIRKKYKALKSYDAQVDFDFQKTFKPVIQPLESIAKKDALQRSGGHDQDFKLIDFLTGDDNDAKQEAAKHEEVVEEEGAVGPWQDASKKRKPEDTSFFANESLVVNTPKKASTSDTSPWAGDLGPIGREIYTTLKQTPSLYDDVFGPKFLNNKHYLGSKRLVAFKNDKLAIGEAVYNASRGLWHLIYMKNPKEDSYSHKDMQDYKQILLSTNAHKLNAAPDGRILASRGLKYTNIIRPLVGKPANKNQAMDVEGSGLNFKTFKKNAQVDYLYYHDPNELVDRLRLLHAEKLAGNNAHQDEIDEIFSELREGKFIK